LGDGSNWSIVDVGAIGVFAVKGSTGGLWLLPFAGGVTTITTSGYWHAVWGNDGYGTITSSVPYGVGTTILRLDISNGSTTQFFARPGQQSSVVGFTPNGNVVIYSQGQYGRQIFTGTGPDITMIADLAYNNFYTNGDPIVDSHGIWVAGNGIALYVYGQGWFWMSRLNGQLAGGCG
jgi:hypothetical protein